MLMSKMFIVILLLSNLSIVFLRHCGQSDTSRPKRIVGGEDSNKDEFPWQASIRWRIGQRKGYHICGGSLIHVNYVLTAAHCFGNVAIPRYYDVTFGAYNGGTSENVQTREIKRIIIHNQYSSSNYDNDIALIELKSPIILNNHINTICLPKIRDFETPDTICTISGWGGTLEEKEASSLILQKADVPIVKFSTCNGKQSYSGTLTYNMFCAGFPDGRVDSCFGDNAGPLQCKSEENGYFRLQGLTSFGDGCGAPHKYGVYTVVRHYLSWIKEKTMGLVVTKSRPIPPKQKHPQPPTE